MTCDLTPDAVLPQRETAGKISLDLAQKTPDTRSPIEQMRESLTDYDANIWECVERGKKDLFGDFYLEVITKQEPLMPNVIRNYFSCRNSCPTPNYDHAVYKYTLQNNHITFLWVIPSRGVCHLLLENRLSVPPEEYGLLEFVLKFEAGDLFKLCKKLNGEV